jgi:hypothetical protein
MGNRISAHEKPELGRKQAALIAEKHPEHPVLGPYAAKLTASSNELEASLAPRKAGKAESVAATDAVAVADTVRDDEYRAAYYLLLAYEYQQRDPALAEVATWLVALLFADMLGVVDLVYAQESVALEGLLDTAAKPEVAAKLALVPHAQEFIDGLRVAENSFKTTVATTPVARTATKEATRAAREAEARFDGVMAGFLGALREVFPGTSPAARAARNEMLTPLLELRAKAKSRSTKAAAKAQTPSDGSTTPASPVT